MPGYLRSLLIAAGVTLFTFLTVGAWYWFQLKPPPVEPVLLLRRNLPALEQLLERQEDGRASEILDRLPLKVVISDAGQQAITSNLGDTPRLRRELAQRALTQKYFTDYLESASGYFRFYYQAVPDFLDAQLLFPLCLGLVLGLSAALWDWYQRRRLEDQTDTLIVMSQTHSAPVLEAQLELAHDANQHLKHELEALRKTLRLTATASPPADTEALRALQKERDQLKTSLAALQAENELELQALRQTAAERAVWEQVAAEHEAALLPLQSRLAEQEDEMTTLHQDLQRLLRDLEQARERIESLEPQVNQLHDAWQEIETLRASQQVLLNKEALWRKDKQRVLGLMHEKDENLKEARQRLKSSRERLRELSVLYKKQLELGQHLATDPAENRSLLTHLIDEKDQIEHENGQLQITLADQRSEIQRLRKELELRAQRLEQAQKMIDQLGQELQRSERELGLVSETLSDKLHDLERIQDLHSEDQQALEAAIQERDLLRQRVSELDQEREQVKHEQVQLSQERLLLEQRLAQIDISAYELEIEQLKQSLQLVSLQQQRRSQTVEDLKGQLQERQAIYERLKRHADAQEKEIARQKQELGLYRSEIEILEAKLSQHEQDDYRFLSGT
ncbi:MAG: hypothetical protein ACO1RX_15255 [Candidatus Sericytochromatia bacterium]